MKKKAKLEQKVEISHQDNPNLSIKQNEDFDKSDKEESYLRKNILQICTAIITFSTLCFTIYQGNKIRENNDFQNAKTQEYNELSVLPKIQLEYFILPNRDFQLKIKNAGVGPAIIDDILFKNKEQKVYFGKKLTGHFWYSIFEDSKISEKVIHQNFYHFYLSQGSFISANREIDFFGVKAQGLSEIDYENAMNIISRSSIYINYHSVYNTSFKDSIVFNDVKFVKLK